MTVPACRIKRSVQLHSASLLETACLLTILLAALLLHGSRAKPVRVVGIALARPDLGAVFGQDVARADSTAGLAEPVLAEASPSVNTPRTFVSAPAARGRGPTAQAAASPPEPHRILMLGDSMIEPIQRRAAAYFQEGGHRFISVIWYGSRTIDWGGGERLRKTLLTYAPTYVMIVLGSNELSARNVEQRLPAVRSLMRVLGDRPAVWIGPPSWREDTGLVSLLKQEVGERFFDSSSLTLERKSDGIHPTDEAGIRWMDRVTRWLQARPSSERLSLPAPKQEIRHHAPAKVWPPPGR